MNITTSVKNMKVGLSINDEGNVTGSASYSNLVNSIVIIYNVWSKCVGIKASLVKILNNKINEKTYVHL